MRRAPRLAARFLAVVALAAATPGVALAHAALLHTSPKAGATVSAVTQIRLVFSEEMAADLCHVGLMTPEGAHVDLKVVSDPHDVHAILAPVENLSPGKYHVMWHAVSADGHPVSGEFAFTLEGKTAAPVSAAAPNAVTPSSTAAAVAEDSAALAGTQNQFPVAAAIARGIGVTALLSLAGLLVFAGKNARIRPDEYRSPARSLAVVAFIALAVHLVLWDRYVLPGGMFASASWESMLASHPGRLELMRVVAALLALVAVFTTSARMAALFFAAAGIVLTALIGHPAATIPLLLVPATLVHLCAVAVWAGGLFSLIVMRRAEPDAFRTQAFLVSRVALVAIIITGLTGLFQAAFLLRVPADLLGTAYGRLVVAKIAGLLALGGFGAYHRFGVLPALPGARQKGMALSLRYEMMVMSLVIIVAAFLSYTPLPR